jgi:hypothetical protein
MATIEDLIGRLGSAKRTLEAARRKGMDASRRGDQAAATLIAGADRIAGLANAVALLCRYRRAAGSVSLVRSMVVTSLAMCWAVSTEGQESALVRETDELQAWRSDGQVAPELDRLDRVGLSDAEAEAADALLKRMELPAAAGAGAGPTPEEALSTALRAMKAAQWAMEKRWPSDIPVLP